MAEELADSMTVSASSGTYSLGPNVTIGSGYSDPYYSAVPNVAGGIGQTYANTAITNNGAATGSLSPYTVSTGITQPWFSNTISPKIKLDGEGADIEVNGWSLIDAIQKIEERLNILHPNEKLEAEWEELRALGEQYRKLEQHIKDKQATWDKLKAMPPPQID
jgi:hypothetical protein